MQHINPFRTGAFQNTCDITYLSLRRWPYATDARIQELSVCLSLAQSVYVCLWNMKTARVLLCAKESNVGLRVQGVCTTWSTSSVEHLVLNTTDRRRPLIPDDNALLCVLRRTGYRMTGFRWFSSSCQSAMWCMSQLRMCDWLTDTHTDWLRNTGQPVHFKKERNPFECLKGLSEHLNFLTATHLDFFRPGP